MTRLGRVICCSLAATSACGAAPAGAGVDAMAAYAGTWKVEIVHLDTPFGKAGNESHTLKNDCWRSGDFYACNQYVDGESKALLVFAYNAKDKTYASYPITVGSDGARAGKLTITDNVWIFPWETTDKGTTTHFRVVNTFTSPRTIEFRQEYSADGEHWTAMASGQEHKLR